VVLNEENLRKRLQISDGVSACPSSPSKSIGDALAAAWHRIKKTGTVLAVRNWRTFLRASAY
jgi:hypothetical protein